MLKVSRVLMAHDMDPEIPVNGFAVVRLSEAKKMIREYASGLYQAINGEDNADTWSLVRHYAANGVLKAHAEAVDNFEARKTQS